MLRGCVKVEVAVQGSPPLIVLTVYVDVKQHLKKKMSSAEPSSCVNRVVVMGSRQSKMDWLPCCFEFFSTVASVYTVFVTVFPTETSGYIIIRRSMAETAGCKEHKWLCTCPLPTTFIVLVSGCCWVLLYVHRNHRLIRDGTPGRPPRLSHSSWALQVSGGTCEFLTTWIACLLFWWWHRLASSPAP